jgi:hypothetical protein
MHWQNLTPDKCLRIGFIALVIVGEIAMAIILRAGLR